MLDDLLAEEELRPPSTRLRYLCGCETPWPDVPRGQAERVRQEAAGSLCPDCADLFAKQSGRAFGPEEEEAFVAFGWQ